MMPNSLEKPAQCQLAFLFWMVSRGALGVVLFAGTGAKAAVVAETYVLPLGVNTLGYNNGKGPAYIIGGVRYSFNWTAVPRPFDFDGNGTTDLTISGNGRTSFTSSMFVTQHGRNQVWALAGGAGGGDSGSHAMALLGGSSFGPSMQSEVPVIGWHNDDDTGHFSILMEAMSGTPVSGAFFPSYRFEQKYLGFRFERAGALHYGWMALSGGGFYGDEIYVYSWAYESEPDTALIVGQLPEPTVPALLGFALWIGMRRGRAVKPLYTWHSAGSPRFSLRLVQRIPAKAVPLTGNSLDQLPIYPSPPASPDLQQCISGGTSSLAW